jgi:hypothetical protein
MRRAVREKIRVRERDLSTSVRRIVLSCRARVDDEYLASAMRNVPRRVPISIGSTATWAPPVLPSPV